ncbi:hypothetical protein ZIOFF_034305 [Zingiber officinale]|uniref:Uncharacterized protein n=1 Tax=Zingiber officinale TaxID=94328 RepID=A0A8J5GRT7_ZINOF|nr:hypothetical protein ZIOFF_034305 [Zingiber officinale]
MLACWQCLQVELVGMSSAAQAVCGQRSNQEIWGGESETRPVEEVNALLEAEREAEATRQAIKRKIAQAAITDFQARTLPAKLRIDPNDPDDVFVVLSTIASLLVLGSSLSPPLVRRDTAGRNSQSRPVLLCSAHDTHLTALPFLLCPSAGATVDHPEPGPCRRRRFFPLLCALAPWFEVLCRALDRREPRATVTQSSAGHQICSETPSLSITPAATTVPYHCFAASSVP